MSENFITVTTFNFPQDGYVARAFLESDGIESRLKDEHLAQVHNFLSQAIGGVKLEVKKSDYEKAMQLLVEGGYLAEPKVPPKLLWIERMDKALLKFGILKKSSPHTRLLWFGLILFLITGILLGMLAYYNYRQSDTEFLTENNWILKGINFGGKSIAPETVYNSSGTDDGFQIFLLYPLEETIDFKKNGKLRIPGFQTPPGEGHWFLKGDSIYFSNINRNSAVFEGAYYFDRRMNSFELISKKTSIHAKKR